MPHPVYTHASLEKSTWQGSREMVEEQEVLNEKVIDEQAEA